MSSRTRLVAAALAVLTMVQAARAIESVGVLAVAGPPGPDEALVALTSALRPALARQAPGILTASELRDRMTGTTQAEPLETLDADYQAALALHAGGDFEASIRALRGLLDRLERLPGGEPVHSRWVRVMLRLARSEQAVGRRSEAQGLLEQLLRIEPDVVVDARLYPPGFERLVEEVRAEVKALWTRRLTVESGPGAQIYLERRPLGAAPVALELPPGRYRVSAAVGAVHSREVVVDLSTDDRSLQIDLSMAQVLCPDAGPGLAIPGTEQTGRLLAAAVWLGLDRMVAVRTGSEDGRSYLAATLHDVHRGTVEREGRVWLDDGALTPALSQALAAYVLAGQESPPVEPGPVLDPAFRLGGSEPTFRLGGSEPTVLLTAPPAASTGSRALGWTAIGTGVAAVALVGISVAQANRANQAYSDAHSMLNESGTGVRPPYTVPQYNDTISEGDRARNAAIGTGVAAGVALVATVVMGYVSYRRTGEIGPLRF